MANVEGGQTYCLRWNNHRTNLAQILQSLGYKDSELDNQTDNQAASSSIADCTLRVDGGFEFRAHRVVLAASSPYLRAALSGATVPAGDNGSVVLVVPGVARDEMRVLLEYMYTGEVRVARADIARVMRIAEQLEVKGLFDMRDSRLRFDGGTPGGDTERAPSPDITTTTVGSGDEHHHNNHHHHQQQQHKTSVQLHADTRDRDHQPLMLAADMDDSFEENEPHHVRNNFKDIRHGQNEAGCLSPYEIVYPRSPPDAANSQVAPPPYGVGRGLSAAYGACADMNPLKRKKLHSMLTSTSPRDNAQDRYRKQQDQQLQDTPILRNVLAQHAPDSSQQNMPVALCRPRDMRTASDGSTDADRPMRGDESPYTDKSYEEDVAHNQLDNNSNSHHNNHHNNHNNQQQPPQQQPQPPLTPTGYHANSTSPLLYAASQHHALLAGGYGHKTNGSTGQSLYSAQVVAAVARDNNNQQPAGNNQQQQQKPEWKRYKQYSRNDIMCAIECVRNGMSALQASRKYNVPSRTLYDKVKKMGITTSRPTNRSFKRGNSLSPANIPYNISGSSSGFAGAYDGDDQPPPHPAAALLDVKFLQQALEGRGGAELAGREALHAMAIAAAAHSAVSGLSASPGTHGNARSPSPGFKFASSRIGNHDSDTETANHLNRRIISHLTHLNHHLNNMKPEPTEPSLKIEPADNEMMDEEDNEVEDLSVARKQPLAEASPEPKTGFQPVQSPPIQQTGVIVQPLVKPNGEEAMERG